MHLHNPKSVTQNTVMCLMSGEDTPCCTQGSTEYYGCTVTYLPLSYFFVSCIFFLRVTYAYNSSYFKQKQKLEAQSSILNAN
jgi:hypothetical protein